MKNCFNCGAQIADEMAICNACGTKQPVAAPNRTSAVPDYYTQGSYTPRPLNVKGLVGFILGIASLVLAWLPVIGLGCGVAGIILSVLGKKAGGNTAYAVIGLILSIIGAAVGFIYTVILIIGIAFAFMDSFIW